MDHFLTNSKHQKACRCKSVLQNAFLVVSLLLDLIILPQTSSRLTKGHTIYTPPSFRWLGGVVVSVSDSRLKRSRFDSGLYHSGQQIWAGCVHLLAQWGVMLWPVSSRDKHCVAVLVAQANSAFHPFGSVNEYQLRLGRQRQVWFIPYEDKRVGVQVKLWDPLTMHCRIWALQK